MNDTVTVTNRILIRPCEGFDELTACVDLQIQVWGYSGGDVIPRRSFVVTQHIGGQVFGAYDTSLSGSAIQGDAGSLIGFAMAMPAIRNSHSYLHSHMLAVRPAYRNQGIGMRLKLKQREEALSRNISLMEWTFDPLVVKNAYLNIQRLGAIVRRYTPDFYGGSSSQLQAGLPTDRLHAEWWMNSSRVEGALSGNLQATKVLATIVVPSDIEELRSAGNPPSALELQSQIRRQFLQAFSNGLAVLGFTKDVQGDGVFQLGIAEESFFS
jgi:predicted GNAT superfamily acetyltransferase